MSALNRVRLWWGLTWATLRERFARLPVDDEARIVGWVPAQGHPSGSESEPSTAVLERAHYAAHDGNPVPRIANHESGPFVRTADLTELVLGDALGDDVYMSTPIHDALVAELEALDAAKRRALRTPTAEFWAIVDASRGYFCTHCADDGDHTECPGCECGCTLLDTPERTPANAIR